MDDVLRDSWTVLNHLRVCLWNLIARFVRNASFMNITVPSTKLVCERLW